MAITLLDGSLCMQISYEPRDSEFEDNICISIEEKCTNEEKIFRAGKTNIFLTPEQARQVSDSLIKAADISSHGSR